MTLRTRFLMLVAVALAACSDDSVGPSGVAPELVVSLPEDAISLEQGWAVPVAVRVLPRSYSGPVALTVSGLPQGVTGTFDRPVLPAVGADNEVTLTLTATASAAAGRVSFTVNATGEGVRPGSATRGLTVEPPAVGNTTWTFRCDVPAWLGVMGQDGTWRRVPGRTGLGGVVRYTFDLPDRGGAVTIMHEQTASDGWDNYATYAGETRYGTRAELSALAPSCPGPGSSNWEEVELAVVGDSLLAGDIVEAGPGWDRANSTRGLATFYGYLDRSLPRDLVVTHLKPSATDPQVARIAIRRRVDLAATYRVEVNLDREGVSPVTAPLTVRGLEPGRGADVSLALGMGGALDGGTLWFRVLAPDQVAPVTIFGVPDRVLEPEDVHVLQVSSRGQPREVVRYFRSVTPQEVVLGPMLDAAVEYAAGGPYPRLSFRGVTQPAYAEGVSLVVTQAFHAWRVDLSPSVLQDGSWQAAIPDLSALPGWQNYWAPSRAVHTLAWTVAAWGSNGRRAGQDGAETRRASRSGSTSY